MRAAAPTAPVAPAAADEPFGVAQVMARAFGTALRRPFSLWLPTLLPFPASLGAFIAIFTQSTNGRDEIVTFLAIGIAALVGLGGAGIAMGAVARITHTRIAGGRDTALAAYRAALLSPVSCALPVIAVVGAGFVMLYALSEGLGAIIGLFGVLVLCLVLVGLILLTLMARLMPVLPAVVIERKGLRGILRGVALGKGHAMGLGVVAAAMTLIAVGLGIVLGGLAGLAIDLLDPLMLDLPTYERDIVTTVYASLVGGLSTAPPMVLLGTGMGAAYARLREIKEGALDDTVAEVFS
ncbi:MAG: hypothetical protein AAF677_02505 [Pseudomonadota bacterium]